MERQATILFLALSLLLASSGAVLPGESTARPIRYKLAKMARSFLGLPYSWGGMSERRGADCSGLVKMIFAKLHIDLPRTSRDQIQSGEEVPVEKLETGDLVFFFLGWQHTHACRCLLGHHQ